MCGIVGYTGGKSAPEVLIEGLYRLEYRGYDSAGIAAFCKNELKVIKTKGRIKELEARVKNEGEFGSTCGIAHTRWATHGAPSDINSHPHVSENGRIALVHNGIIENYLEIREMLIKRGFHFQSETDTETAVHLIEYYYKGDLLEAVQKAVSQIRGSYAFGIISLDNPDEVIGVRHESPLVIGLGDGENMIASDVTAIISHTKRYYVMDDNEIAVIRPDCVRVYNQYGDEVKKEEQIVTWDISAAEKGGYKHFMIKEIMEEPKAIRDTVSPRIKNGMPDISETGIPDEFLKKIKRVQIVACGSALHAGLVGREVIESLCRIPAFAEIASEFRYRDPIIGEGDLCIIVSQSGETADTLAALREAKKKGAKTLSIVNVVSSSIARESDGVLYTWAGPEIAVATTKAYSAQLAAMYLIAIKIAHVKGMISDDGAKKYCEALQNIPALTEKMLKKESEMQFLAANYINRDNVFFIGRGLDFAAAMEASLKLKEISYIHSEAYAAGELKHGTISLIEDGMMVVALATDKRLYEKMVSNIKEVKARGADVVLVTCESFEVEEGLCNHLITIPECEALMAASLSVIPMQLLAYYIAVGRGCDVDKPRNLAKSVTVE